MSIYGSVGDHAEWIVPELSSGTVWLVGVLLFVAGVIMTAGGAGGGSVFVPILIGVGCLETHQAIPLSKFVIFAGSVCSYILLTVHTWQTHHTSIIDFGLVRAIVPMSLAGTLIGVALNVLLSSEVLLILLSCLLTVLFVKSAMLSIDKYRQDKLAEVEPVLVVATPTEEVERKDDVSLKISADDMVSLIPSSQKGFWSSTTGQNWLMASLVPLSIVCGFTSKLDGVPLYGEIILLIVPIVACICVTWFFHTIEPRIGIAYPLVGLLAGISSGLFGLGGGVIYSPFLLHAKLKPAVAVAVSTTCVFFASASSTFQYVFMGRISILFGLFYSCFAIAASVVAQKLIWLITEKLRRPFYIFCLVTAIIGSSLAFTIAKSIMISQDNT